MKAKVLISLIVLLIILSGNSFAQVKIKVGFRTGCNLGGMSGEGTEASSSETKFITSGPIFGAASLFEFGKILGLSPELVFIRKGVKYLGEDLDYTYTTVLNYAELPVLLHLQFGGEKFKMVLKTGPSVGICVSGKYKFRDEDGLETEVIDLEKDEVSRTDVAFNFAPGFALKNVGPGDIEFDMRLQLGITSLNSNSATRNYYNAHNNGFSVNLFYMFNLSGD